MASDSSTSDEYLIKETATLNWTIKGFQNLKNVVYSEEFLSTNSKNIFQLSLNSKIAFKLYENEVFIRLWYNGIEDELPMRYRVSIMNEKGKTLYTKEYRSNYYYKKEEADNRIKNVNFTNFIDYDSCLKCLVNGNCDLILKCEVDVLEKSLVHVFVNLQKDYQALLDNSESGDFVLLVKGKEFKVHKIILAARSKVFERMFSADLEEKKQNRVDITDVEADVFEHLLRYIYTGKIPDIKKYASDLFVAADKYQLDHLKASCVQFLCSSFTVDSVIKLLFLADKHSASEFKSKCFDFINENSSAVIATEGWKELESRPDLLKGLYEKQSNDKTKRLRTK